MIFTVGIPKGTWSDGTSSVRCSKVSSVLQENKTKQLPKKHFKAPGYTPHLFFLCYAVLPPHTHTDSIKGEREDLVSNSGIEKEQPVPWLLSNPAQGANGKAAVESVLHLEKQTTTLSTKFVEF